MVKLVMLCSLAHDDRQLIEAGEQESLTVRRSVYVPGSLNCAVVLASVRRRKSPCLAPRIVQSAISSALFGRPSSVTMPLIESGCSDWS